MTTAPRLPIILEKGAKTSIRAKDSRHVARNGFLQVCVEWDVLLCQYDIGYSERNAADFKAAEDMFYCWRKPFRFKVWQDSAVTQVNLGTGNGTITDFALRTQRSAGGVTYNHPVYAPVVGTITVYLDAVVVPLANWTLVNTGPADTVPVIHFATAPAAAKVVTASFEKDVPVVWAMDVMGKEITSATIGKLRGIVLWEVLKNPDV
jgi:uncharacterized protein (TIGR02217 family)